MCRWNVIYFRRSLSSWGHWPVRWDSRRWPAARSYVPVITRTRWLRAMRSPILMPDVGAEMPSLNLWFAQPGDAVYAGDRLVELLLNGTTFDVSSPSTGRLAEKIAR